MVAPPDPVAVESVAEPAKVPRGIMRTLQTEGLFNDAVAIVVFSTSIRSLDGEGEFSHVFLNFLVGAVLAVAIGYVIGWLASAASRTIRNVATTGAVTIIVPFVAYLVAEEVHASGVIAVVVTALEINRRIDPEALEALQIQLLNIIRGGLHDDLKLMVLIQTIRIVTVAPVRRTARRLDIGDVPRLGAQDAQEG